MVLVLADLVCNTATVVLANQPAVDNQLVGLDPGDKDIPVDRIDILVSADLFKGTPQT